MAFAMLVRLRPALPLLTSCVLLDKFWTLQVPRFPYLQRITWLTGSLKTLFHKYPARLWARCWRSSLQQATLGHWPHRACSPAGSDRVARTQVRETRPGSQPAVRVRATICDIAEKPFEEIHVSQNVLHVATAGTPTLREGEDGRGRRPRDRRQQR